MIQIIVYISNLNEASVARSSLKNFFFVSLDMMLF